MTMAMTMTGKIRYKFGLLVSWTKSIWQKCLANNKDLFNHFGRKIEKKLKLIFDQW